MREMIKKDGRLYIITLIHIILSFIWEKSVFVNVGINPSGTKAVSNFLSDKAEQTVTYILTHLFAAVMIYFTWKLILFICSEFKKEYILFIVLFIVGALFILVSWPEVLTGAAGFDDNLVTYSCGVRLTPDYWHGVYSSIVYAAMLLVCPVNFFITLFQWGLFLFVIAYIFERLNGVGYLRGYLTFLIFLLPAALYLASNGHRMYQFTILVILYTAVIANDLYGQKERTGFEFFKIAALGAFISVFRSEGIIIGVLFFGIYVLFGGKRKLSVILARIAVFALLFIVMYLPGKIGEKKYYGKDYSVINTFDVLRYILNDERCNIDYPGGAEDMAAIGAVLPIDVIKSGGTDGYRRYNYNIRGNMDINQSGTDTKTGEEFMKAYRRVASNNLKLCAESQFNSVMVAIGVGTVYKPADYKGEPVNLEDWHYCGWDNGTDDFYRDSFTDKWYNNDLRKSIAVKVMAFRDRYYSFLKNRKLYVTGIMLMVVTSIVLFVRGLVAYIKNKDRIKLAIGFMFLAGILSFAAVCVVMPTSATIYFIGSIYCLLTLLLVFFCHEFKGLKRKSQK